MPAPVTSKPAVELKPEKIVEKLTDPPREARFETTGYPKAAFDPVIDPAVKQKNSPWALHIEMLDGQTIITATVNKKHEFKIVCQSLDLQTGKGTLKASGKVQISGDMMNGTCEQLAIGLHEDRLLLEGRAEVTIQKVTTNVSDARPAAFELKGETLNLRISELEAGKIIQTSARQVIDGPRDTIRQASLPNDGKQWSPYGTLRRSNTSVAGETAWRLEDSAGKVVAVLVARDGGTLAQYEGRTISVYGVNEQMNGRTVLRVSHIALP